MQASKWVVGIEWKAFVRTIKICKCKAFLHRFSATLAPFTREGKKGLISFQDLEQQWLWRSERSERVNLLLFSTFYYSLLCRGNCWSCRYWGPLRSAGGLQWFWPRRWHYQYWIDAQTISQAIFLLKQKSPSWSQISGRRCCRGKGSK